MCPAREGGHLADMLISQPADEKLLQTPLPEGTDEDAVLPAGIAPGAGEVARAELGQSRASA